MNTWDRIDHVQLCVPPGEQARTHATAFYGEVLGLDSIDKPDSLSGTDSFWFGNGDVEIHLGPEVDTEPSRRHPAFAVSDLASLRERLEEEGDRNTRRTTHSRTNEVFVSRPVRQPDRTGGVRRLSGAIRPHGPLR